MDFRKWTLLFSLLGIIVFFAYYVSKAPDVEPKIDEASPSAVPETDKDDYVLPDNWEKFNGETITFYYPNDWDPSVVELFGGAVIESINLGIPDSLDANIAYSAIPYDLIRPSNIVFERDLNLNGKSWEEWIREESDHVSYDFYTKEIPINEVGSFGVYVAVTKENEDIEHILITFINSIEFTGGDKKADNFPVDEVIE